MAKSLTDVEYTAEGLLAEFYRAYGGDSGAQVYSSPARINIIGEHIDYNGGKVFPAAIDRSLFVAIRRRADRKAVYDDVRFPGRVEFDLDGSFAYRKEDGWANYLNGILSQLLARGCRFDSGFEILMASNIPAGGGISSSSALECGFAWAVSETFGFGISRKDIAILGQMSEHNFMGVNCGIMDQFIIANGRKDTAMVLDCATLEFEYAPLVLGDHRFVVMNTNKVRRLADSKYNERRAQCEEALRILNAGGVPAKSLCEMDGAAWAAAEHLVSAPVLRKRVRHCVTENARVLAAAAALKAGDLAELGRLLNESHRSLREDYEVTGPELDALAAAAQSEPGCLGARMTGAGFGGCAIALVHKDAVAQFTANVQKAYTAAVGYEAGFFACSSGDGVARVI